MRISIGQKITLSFLLVALLVGVLGIFGYSNMKKTAKDVDVVTEREAPDKVDLSEMKSQLLGAIEEAFAYPLLGDPIEKSEFYDKLEQFDTSAVTFKEENHIGQHEESEETELFNQIIAAKEALAIAAGKMFEGYERDGTVNRSHVVAFEEEIDVVIPLIDRFLEIESEEVGEAHHNIDVTIARGKRAVLFTVSAATLLATGLGLLISHSISGPIKKLKDAASRIGRGEFDTLIDIRSKDEIGDLGLSFSKMTQDLRHTTVSRDYVDNIIRSMIDALIVINPDGTIRTVNRATQELSGYGEDELIGKPISLIFAEDAAAAFKHTKHQALVTERPIRDLNLTILTKSGESIPVAFSGSAMRDATGKLTANVVLARDTRETNRLIEQEKQLATAAAAADAQIQKARELEDALKKLQTTQAQLVQSGKMAGLGQIGAGIAHELIQPITSIQGFAQRLRKRDGSAQMSKELDIIIQGTHRMARIVDNIRAFARQGDFEAKPTDPVEPLDDALMLLSEQLRLHGVEVEKTAEEALPRILADKIRLQQVFFNLLDNALDALDQVHEGKPKRLHIGLERHGTQVLYTFEDSGPGIADAIESQIFDPFFTTKPDGKGTGLGLSLSYGIVADHGGEITYRRAASGGGRFTVRIPVALYDADKGSETMVAPVERRGKR